MYRSLYEAGWPADHPDIARGLSNVGLCYEKSGSMEEGLKYYQ